MTTEFRDDDPIGNRYSLSVCVWVFVESMFKDEDEFVSTSMS